MPPPPRPGLSGSCARRVRATGLICIGRYARPFRAAKICALNTTRYSLRTGSHTSLGADRLQAAAEAAHKGIFNEANAASSVRSIKWAGTFDPTSLLNIYINKPQPDVNEQVST